MTEALKNLPPVAEMMRDCGLEPKKQFGQNFLFDLNLTRKIARAVPNISELPIVEIGPGPAGLTRALLEVGARRLVVVEKDKTTKPILERVRATVNEKLEVVYADAMKLNLMDLVGQPYAICANLPYNIGTELLVQWVQNIADGQPIVSLTLMFQREVAQRIVAKVGDKEYGRLAVLVALVGDAKILFDVPNTAFFPKPKVQSAVVQIIPNAEKLHKLGNLKNIEKITARLFGQRRKMIRAIMPNVNWSMFNLCGTERAEQLKPETFAEIAKVIQV